MHSALTVGLKGRVWGLLLLALLSSAVLPKKALANFGGLALSFSGRVFAPAPCKINNDETISISFEKIGIDKIDGKNYAVIKTLPITCDAGTLAPLQLQIQGESVIGKANVLQTNRDNLGIALYNAGNNRAISLNQFFDVNRSASFLLKVIPVKISDSAPLSEGSFVANATVVSRYN
ncbi:fimbrial protein [Serratia aquatilis]|uniref:Fimbrial protein n=1 Tax=Serratia aquatilis TaxID=1737515 RepID=A0ABV6E9V9_9GAMM